MMTTHRIKLSSKQGRAFRALENNLNVTEVFYGGAAGGGKTFFGCVWQIHRRIEYPGTRGLIGRSVLKNLKQTTLKTFFDVARDFFGMLPDEHFKYKAQDGIIQFKNGSEILLKDLFSYPSDPDFASLGSLEISDVFIDECTEITLKAFEIVNSRIRYKINEVGGAPKILLAGNPAHNWVKFRYVLDEKNQPVELKPYQMFVPALVDDNPDAEFKRLYKQQLQKLNKYDRQRLLLGDWVVNKNDHPFFYEYSDEQHISKQPLIINEDFPIWISFDFNIDPTTAVIGQRIPGEGLYIYRLHQVKGGTRRLCEQLQKYRDYPLRVTGDRSGNSGNTAAGLVGGQLNTDYNIIKTELSLSPRQIVHTTKANKKHVHSRAICNSVLFEIPLLINQEGCEGLINDLQTAQPTSQGKLLKDRDMHKQDAGDAFRYLINGWFPRGMKDVNAFKRTMI